MNHKNKMLIIFIYLITCLKFDKPEVYRFVLEAGQYKVQCYGAQGGPTGGKGAYVSGKLTITGPGTTFYAYVGGIGRNSGYDPNPGGFNGGGMIKSNNKYSGGGATDLRIDNTSYQNRIIVAAGGSATIDIAVDEDISKSYYHGAPGGDIFGYRSIGGDRYIESEAVNQIYGAEDGIAENGGGGGYKGGVFQSETISISGSSYISGHPSCTEHRLKFTEYEMVKGFNSGNGSIVIEPIFECPNGCTSCEGQNQCTECFDGFLSDGKCVSECPSGTFSSGHDCVSCSQSCEECKGTANFCIKCKESYVFHENECIEKCPDGFVEIDKKCTKCKYPCEKCESEINKCLSCAENYILVDKKCYSECPGNSIRVGSSCQECDTNCASCYPSFDKCTSCDEGFFLDGNSCVPSCPKGKFGQNKQCVECQHPCETCSSVDTCITCIDGYSFQDGKCFAACPLSTTQVGNYCVTCSAGCKKCSDSPENCQKCDSDYYFYENGCHAKCSELNDKESGKSFGKDDENKVCKECSVSNCGVCDEDYSVCNKCSESFVLEGGACVPKQEEKPSESTNQENSSESSTNEQSSSFFK